MNTLHNWINTAGIALLVILGLVGGNQSVLGGSSDSGWNATGDGCISVDGTCIIDASGNLDGVVTSSTGSFSGLVTLEGGQLKSYTNASSSVTTGTLAQSDILNYDTILLEPTGAAATKTLTFPATSTLTSFVPTAGDRQDTCFFNATTTAASTITFAAGAGIALENVASTTPDLILGADNTACFTFIRKTNTDIVAAFIELVDAD